MMDPTIQKSGEKKSRPRTLAGMTLGGGIWQGGKKKKKMKLMN
jgi:hypothetical protein